MLTYDQMNEIAAYGGFPSRYPHWRFGMEYEQLAKSYEYGLSKIYEMVINNNPSYAYLLEGNSLTEQKLVMAHVFGHVDFFKNNFCFRATDLDQSGPLTDPIRRPRDYDPDRRWIDKMANHGARSRHIERHGINKVEAFLDQCLSLENLIDPWAPFTPKPPQKEESDEPGPPSEVPKLRAKEYMDAFINPEEYLEAQKLKREARRPWSALPRQTRARRAALPARPRAARALGARRARGHPRRGLLLRAADADEDHERGLGQLLALEA
jgi:stage V sporulation protein R